MCCNFMNSFILWYVSKLMPARYAQETGTRNLCMLSYTTNLHVCQSILYKFFLVQVSCTQLSTALFQHRNCLAHDMNCAMWLARELFCARNCDKLASNFSCQLLVKVSWACVASIRHKTDGASSGCSKYWNPGYKNSMTHLSCIKLNDTPVLQWTQWHSSPVMNSMTHLSLSSGNRLQVGGLLVELSFMKDEVTETINTLIRQWQAAETSADL